MDGTGKEYCITNGTILFLDITINSLREARIRVMYRALGHPILYTESVEGVVKAFSLIRTDDVILSIGLITPE